jgi:hypothetical protein
MCGEARCNSPRTGYAGLQQKEFGSANAGNVRLPSFMDRRLIAHTGIGYTQTVKAAVRENDG